MVMMTVASDSWALQIEDVPAARPVANGTLEVKIGVLDTRDRPSPRPCIVITRPMDEEGTTSVEAVTSRRPQTEAAEAYRGR